MKAYYHARAPEYDDWWRGERLYAPSPPGWKEESDAVIEVVRSLPPARTLDVACGTGFITRHLTGAVVGLDQSDAMLAAAARQASAVAYVQGDALDLPFPDGSFDRVFTSHFYGHLEEPERLRFLAEAWRVARELVVLDAALHDGAERAEWQERTLNDGSRWTVYKRFFAPETLLAELGGRVLHSGRWFIVAAA